MVAAAAPRKRKPREIELTEAQAAQLAKIRQLYEDQAVQRTVMVEEVCKAFDMWIPSYQIGQAMDMSEAGARQIRKRRK